MNIFGFCGLTKTKTWSREGEVNIFDFCSLVKRSWKVFIGFAKQEEHQWNFGEAITTFSTLPTSTFLPLLTIFWRPILQPFALSPPRDVLCCQNSPNYQKNRVYLRKRALDVAKKDFVWREVLLWHFQTQYCQKLWRNFPTWKLEKLVSPGRRHKNMFREGVK